MPSGPPRRRRARAVPDAPIDALLARSEDLAKGWLLALLEDVPLQEAPRIAVAELTRHGPRLCDSIVGALAVDDQQLQLAPLAARIGEFAGARSAEAVSAAVDALHAVVWAALRAELDAPEVDLVGELAERLARVTGVVRAVALRAHDEAAAGLYGPESRPVAARAWFGVQRSGEETEPAGVKQVEQEIDRSGGSPLAIVLAELEDADKMLAVETEAGVASVFGAYAEAVRGAVGVRDTVVFETDSRTWIVAPQTGRAGARALGARISAAVAQREPWRGAPMVASIGVAVMGEDGTTAAELIEAAEEARFVASANGST
jgi:GGDEF domain-containing protein